MKDKLIFVCLLRSIDKLQLMWGKYTVKEGKNKGLERKALVHNGEAIFISSKLTQEQVRAMYDTLVISKIGDQKVCHQPGITADEAF
jgi:hypothetical protein